MCATFRPSGISVYIRQDLDEGAARSGTTLIIDPIITADGHRVTMSDIGDICFAKIDQGTSNEEIISFTGITDNTSTYTLTGCVWGYNFYNGTGSVSANQKKHISGSKIIITNDDHFLNLQYVNVDGTQTIAGAKTFTVTPQSNGGSPALGTDLVIKSYVDALVLGTLTTINVIVPGKAGENVAIGQPVYFDETDNEWKLTDADTAATVQNVLLGIAQGAGTNGNAIANGVLLQGVDVNQSGLTEGDVQYIGNTAGSISSTPGTTEVTVGIAKSATELYFNPRFNQQLTEDQQDALAGTSGTPSSTNKYVTNDDTAGTGDIVRESLVSQKISKVLAENISSLQTPLKIYDDSGVSKLKKVLGLSDQTTFQNWNLVSGGVESYDVLKTLKMSDTSFILLWTKTRTNAQTRDWFISAATISGKTVTFGSAVTFQSHSSEPTYTTLELTKIDSSRFAASINTRTLNYARYAPYTKLYSVSGTTITEGDSTTWGYTVGETNGGLTVNFKGVALVDTDKLVGVFHSSGTGGTTNTEAKVALLSGLTWNSFGTTYEIINATEVTAIPAKLANGRVMFMWSTNARVATISGSTLSTVGTGTLTATPTNYFYISDNNGVIVHTAGSNTTVSYITENASTITYNFSKTVASSGTLIRTKEADSGYYMIQVDNILYPVILDLANSRFVVKTGNTLLKTSSGGAENGFVVLSKEYTYISFWFINSSNDHYIYYVSGKYDFLDTVGTNSVIGNSGDTIVLNSIGSVDSNFTNVIMGVPYYVDVYGNITTESTTTYLTVSLSNKFLGYGVSTTEILISL